MPVTALLRAIVFAAMLFAPASPALAMGSSGGSDGSSTEQQQAGAYERGAAAAQDGRYREAIGLLQEAVHHDPGNADAYNWLGYSHRKLGEFDPARTYYTKALDIDPAHVDAMEYLGELHVETGDLASAEAMLDRIEAQCGRTCEQFQVLDDSIAEALGN